MLIEVLFDNISSTVRAIKVLWVPCTSKCGYHLKRQNVSVKLLKQTTKNESVGGTNFSNNGLTTM